MSKLEFAKLFETEEYGQVLVKIGGNDRGPEIHVCYLPDATGIRSSRITYEDTEKGAAVARTLFDLTNEKSVLELVKMCQQNARGERIRGAMNDTFH